MQFFTRPAYLVSICLLLIAGYLSFTPVEEQVVGETVHAIYPHVRLRSEPPKSLSENNYDSEYLDPDEVWIVCGQAQGAGENSHELGLWLQIRHPHNGRERWVASWLVKPSATIVTLTGTRTRVAGGIALANARLVMARNRENFTAIATILGSLAAIAALCISSATLRLQRTTAQRASTP
jgi:hypothetical protein